MHLILAALLATAHRDSFFIDSRALHERRLVNVHLPAAYSAAGSNARRFPVLYMPDGGMNEDFPHIVRAVDSLTEAGAIPPTIVVGIPNTERRRDLTGPTRAASDSAIAPRVGGSSEFRQFIRDELFGEVDRRYRTTSQRAIIGESLAGLFIVETLLREPALFQRYAAFDPSLWWNRGQLVDSATALLAGASRPPNTFVFMGVSMDGIDDRTSRMAEILSRGRPSGIALRFEQHSELTHGTIFSALESRALVFVLR